MFCEPSVVQHIGNAPLSYSDSWARLLRDVGHTNFDRDLGTKAQMLLL